MPLCFPSTEQTNKTFKQLKKNHQTCHDINLFHCFNAGICFFSLNAEWGDGGGFVLICDSRITGGRGKDWFLRGGSGGANPFFVEFRSFRKFTCWDITSEH